ncbi:malonyl-CoA O-methyltransferase [Litorivivens lipolytica]|uniref:Malonyl-[acyl-carrier protein] O-methyltransferase n=1 Tax=Litorivivens lipolytica TaxID=1524264 RepID=A0A7W4Z7D1_9GAMM|nr:malonyl-ACP O-methyltransferase BioC [Litorivivens lipolytica]MBB3047791.1 malonyl-CoA O-methyltransferase [Litorivivens lipolytica]
MLYRERLPARQGDAELVLLHGWGSSSACWRSALPLLRDHFNVTLVDLPGHGRSANYAATYEQFTRDLLEQLPAKAMYLGWSLGGMIATRITADFPERVSALITVASNPSFIRRDDWPAAMPSATFDDFLTRFQKNPVRGLKRFDVLQGGVVGSELGAPEVQYDVLHWLAELDNRQGIAQLNCPSLFLFGEKDGLVPVAVTQQIGSLQNIQVFSDSGHQPFLEEPEAFWSAVIAFCQRHKGEAEVAQHYLDKQKVAASFSRAAESYDGVADLQRRVADYLADKLNANSASALDLGTGTGYSLPALNAQSDTVIAMDLAEGMLAYAREQKSRPADAWLCGDAEDLPLADDSVNTIFSSLAVQWCENIAAVFAEAYRVLKPGGTFLLSTLGPDTLFELREAGKAADNATHVNRFLPREVLERGIERSGLTLQVWQQTTEVLEYQTLRELMNELKSLGAHNVNSDRGMMGKQAMKRFIAAYEDFRQPNGKLPASYQVWYLALQKPKL